MSKLVAVITGASKGIGLAIAQKLVQDDRFNTVHCISRTKCHLESPKIKSHCIDISNHESTAYHLRHILKDTSIHLLINSAGICNQHNFQTALFSDIQKEISINLLGTMSVTHTLLKNLVPNSHIINISSIMGRIPTPTYSSYCASKFGLVGFSECLRFELAHREINVSCLLPTLVDTEMIVDKVAITNLIYSISPEKVANETMKLVFNHSGLKSIGEQATVACMAERLSPFVKRFMFN